MSIVALYPGRLSGVPVLSGEVLPLGSVLVAQTVSWDASVHLPQLAAIHAYSPWVPLAVVGAAERLAPVVDLLPLVRGPLQVLHVAQPVGGAELAAAIWGAVVQRSPPQAEEISWYCGLRLGQGAAGLVGHALAGAAYRSLRRRLKLIQCASPGMWRRRLTVLRALSFGWGRGWTEASAASELGLAAGTLSRGCRRCFGLTWPQLVRIGTWEGALEQALRWDAETVGRGERLDRSGRKVAKAVKSGAKVEG